MSARTLFGDERLPLVCVPLIAQTHADLLADAAAVVSQHPDVIEWRADHFVGIETKAITSLHSCYKVLVLFAEYNRTAIGTIYV